LKEDLQEHTGFEALFLAALDSDVSLITGVPGYPITSLMELFLEAKRKKELKVPDKPENISESIDSETYTAYWLANEKVALEFALGASVSGKRTLVLVKHVGMNLLSDPLITSVTHTIGAGLVIIAGDDPGVKGSQNEQDSRWYGKIAEIAVFDPSDPDTAYRILRRAYELSEETKIPVVVRVTAGLEKIKGKILRLQKSSYLHPEFDRAIWRNRMFEKHQLFHSRVYPLLEAEAENTELNKIRVREENPVVRSRSGGESFLKDKIATGSKAYTIGIISSGFTTTKVEEIIKRPETFSKSFKTSDKISRITHLCLNLVNPLPIEKIKIFLSNNEKVLIAEESEPFIEEQVRIAGNVYGKKTGHLPYGQVTSEDIEFALENMRQEKISGEIKALDSAFLENVNKGRASVCPDCPYLPLYHFLSKLDTKIAGDMGCSVRSAPEPLAAVDVSFALGSAISVACGFKGKGIAVIGDFALAHSGILGLLSAVDLNCNVLVLVLQNEVAAMTGGQSVPDLRKVVEAITSDVTVFEIDLDEVIDNSKNSGKTDDRIKETEIKINTSNEEYNENNNIGKNVKKAEEKKESKTGERLLDPALQKLIQEKRELPGISVLYIKGKCKRF